MQLNSLDLFSSCTYLTHGLHLNSRGEKQLTRLIAMSLSHNNVLGSATTSPFLVQKHKGA